MADELWKKLKKYGGGDSLPMHMPGHKRRGGYDYLDALSPSLDITEIEGFDDLNDPRGILRESEDAAARLWGSRETVYSVNGSTSCVLAAIRALCPAGSRIVMARNCHRSAYHAAELCSLDPVFVMPEVLPGIPAYRGVTPEAVSRALTEAPDAAAVVITSPTYEGVISDVRGIAEAAHRAGVPLIVDEAHGAHLGLFGVFGGGAVGAGADVVIHSLHKTLSSLTQTAALHICGDLADAEEVRRQAAIFQTSSPSYLLVSSIDGCVRRLAERGEEDLSAWKNALTEFRYRTAGLRNITEPLQSAGDIMTDPTKIYLTAAASGVTGTALAGALREKYRVETEMAGGYGVLAMTGQGDTAETLARFADALVSLDGEIVPSGEPVRAVPRQTKPPEKRMAPADALRMKKETVPASRALGRVAAEYVAPYPPGVPVLIPGEAAGPDEIGIILSSGRSAGDGDVSLEVVAE